MNQLELQRKLASDSYYYKKKLNRKNYKSTKINLVELAEMDETGRLVKLPPESGSIFLQLLPLLRGTDSVHEITHRTFKEHQQLFIVLRRNRHCRFVTYKSKWAGPFYIGLGLFFNITQKVNKGTDKMTVISFLGWNLTSTRLLRVCLRGEVMAAIAGTRVFSVVSFHLREAEIPFACPSFSRKRIGDCSQRNVVLRSRGNTAILPKIRAQNIPGTNACVLYGSVQ